MSLWDILFHVLGFTSIWVLFMHTTACDSGNEPVFYYNLLEVFTYCRLLFLYQELLINFLELKIKNIDSEIELLNIEWSERLKYLILSKLYLPNDFLDPFIDQEKRLIRLKITYTRWIKSLKNELDPVNFNTISNLSGFLVDVSALRDNILKISNETHIPIKSISKISKDLLNKPFKFVLYVNLSKRNGDFASYKKVVQDVAESLELNASEISANLKNSQ